TLEQRWGRRGWLLGPRPAATAAELERWLTDTASDGGEESGDPSLVLWSTAQGPLAVTQVPQQPWLLLCSLTLLGLGLLLAGVTLPRVLFWGLLVLCAAGLIALGATVPAILPAVAYGCEPGLMVLLLVFLLQWLLHERYRRQVVFLPGFSRRK